MQIFSKQVEGKTPDTQRRLYTLFQRAVKRGEVPALKLLTRFEIRGFKGQPRQVQDYAYTDDTAEQVSVWIDQQEMSQKMSGFTVDQVQGFTDAELSAFIQQQTSASGKRKVRSGKSTKKQAAADTRTTPKPTE